MHRWVLTAKAEAEACMVPVRNAMLRIQQFVADEEAVQELDLALTEACANVARHAYPPDRPGPVEVTVEIRPGRTVALEVADHGKGALSDETRCLLPEPDSDHGRGLYIMSRCCDRLTIHSKGGRNSVRMVRDLGPDAWKTIADPEPKGETS